jgi:hypothetical protein
VLEEMQMIMADDRRHHISSTNLLLIKNTVTAGCLSAFKHYQQERT